MMIKRILEFLCAFILLFSFRVPVLFTSNFLLLIVLCILYMFYFRTASLNLKLFFRYKITVQVFCFLLAIAVLTFLFAVLHQSNDYSLLITVCNQIFNFLLVILFLAVFYEPRKKDALYFMKLVCLCFAAQGLIMAVSLLSPSFKQIIELSQTEEVIE